MKNPGSSGVGLYSTQSTLGTTNCQPVNDLNDRTVLTRNRKNVGGETLNETQGRSGISKVVAPPLDVVYETLATSLGITDILLNLQRKQLVWSNGKQTWKE